MTGILIDMAPKDYNVYVEGFGGGASLLFAKEPKGIEVYNDLSKGVYALFKCLSDTEAFDRLKMRMELTPYSRELHDEYTRRLKQPGNNMEEIAYLFLYVNRSSFNGVGGFSVSKYIRRGMSRSTSNYLSMIDGLSGVHGRLSTVIIENLDIFDLIDKYDDEAAFMYLDPPYVHETRKSSQRYQCEMSDEDHAKLVQRAINMKSKVMISGYDHPIYDALSLNGWRKTQFTRPNSKDIETLYMNYGQEG